MELGLIIVFISLAAILVTFILNILFKKKRYIKYIPVIIMFPFMLYYFITVYSAPTENFEALGRFVIGLFLLTGSLASLISSIALDFFHKNRNKY